MLKETQRTTTTTKSKRETALAEMWGLFFCPKNGEDPPGWIKIQGSLSRPQVD